MSGRRVRTSKALALAVILSAVPLLWMGKLDAPPAAMAYGVAVAAAVWNRVDSRRMGYSFEVKGPGGSGVRVRSDGRQS